MCLLDYYVCIFGMINLVIQFFYVFVMLNIVIGKIVDVGDVVLVGQCVDVWIVDIGCVEGGDFEEVQFLFFGGVYVMVVLQ